jgi:hypothetical protein
MWIGIVLMPIQIRIGIETMPCQSYPKFYTCWKIGQHFSFGLDRHALNADPDLAPAK